METRQQKSNPDSASRSVSPARRAAFDVLVAIPQGAFASDALRAQSIGLSERDAGLATQIVLGSLRLQNQLDYLIELYSGRALKSLDLPVLAALRMSIFQIRHLERVPAHAVVDDAVELVKHSRRAASGLVNAVLRKVDRTAVDWPSESLAYGCPQWILDRWTAHFGREPALGIAAAALQEPHRYTRGERYQDIGSQAIIPLLDLQPGHSYLDLCAAPGNKTLQALETPLGLTVACDVSETRLRTVPPVCHRVALDATQPLPFDRKFDRIFVDAPCSGTGTLARNPEIKWRLQPDEILRHKFRQLSIVHQALQLLSDSGSLLYSTCSLEDEESGQVIKQTLKANPRLRCLQEHWRLPGRDEGDGFYAALLSWENSV